MASVLAKLESFNANNGTDSTEVAVQRIHRTLCKEEKEAKSKQHASFRTIPTFYFKTPRPDSGGKSANHIARLEARTRFLENKANFVCNDRELTDLRQYLEEKALPSFTPSFGPQLPKKKPTATPPAGTQDDSTSTSTSLPPAQSSTEKDTDFIRMDYLTFKNLAAEAPPKFQRFFTARVFGVLPQDTYGQVSVSAFLRYVEKHVALTQLRINLTCFDESATTYLREQELENYIFDQIPQMPQLASMDRDFYPYYVFTAARKFMYFLDPYRKGKIPIQDMVSSSILYEFEDLRMPFRGDVDRAKGWFTAESALCLYATYLRLDTDRNGMLSRDEFMRFKGGALTPVFVDRLFQEYRMYLSQDGVLEMDYKTFLDFQLSLYYRDEYESLRFFWRILDINRKGYITLSVINYFFKSVSEKMVALGHDVVRVEDVANEIFDMVKPKDPHKITLDDLHKSGVGAIVVGILTDINAFWRYENREQLASHDDSSE